MDRIRAQRALGSLLVDPPRRWEKSKEEFVKWQHDGVHEVLDGLPYSLEDMLFFARVNFSPDKWYTVIRGPMAGHVFWWTHDGDSKMAEPWAASIQGWGEKVCDGVPGLFEGVIRFGADDCIENAPPEMTLFPDRYVADLRASR